MVMMKVLVLAAVVMCGFSSGNPLQEIVFYGNGNDQVKDFQLLVPVVLENVRPRAATVTPSPIRDYLVAPTEPFYPTDRTVGPPGVQLHDGPFSNIPAHEFSIDTGGDSVKKDLSAFRPGPGYISGFNFRVVGTDSAEEDGYKCDVMSCYICCVLDLQEARQLASRLVRPRSRPGPSWARSLARLVRLLGSRGSRGQ